jgi:hypothetical protein
MYKHLDQYIQRRNFGRVHFEKKAPLDIATLTLVQAQALSESLVADASPENVSCDGEASMTHVRTMLALYRGAARDLLTMFPNLVRPEWDDAELFSQSATTPIKPTTTFKTGDHVMVTSPKLGGRVMGRIVKVNRVRARVDFMEKGIFNVPFGMLQNI